MGKIGYLDCPTGIAGDMCLGALVDAGLPWEYLVDSLAGLGMAREYQLKTEKVNRNGQLATKVYVDLLNDKFHTNHYHHHHPRHLPEIISLIESAELPARVKDWSLAVFQQLAIAEGAVHGVPPEKVHFHEVGATDAIVDIVGTCLGLDWLDIDELHCSPMPTGGGIIKAAHGKLPVPVPAVVKLWESRQVPVYSNAIEKELVTPTGAAIATTLAAGFGSPPAMKLTKMGLGAGSRDLSIPNILRLWVGESSQNEIGLKQETVTVLETQIDDLNPQAIAYTLEQLLAAGALDAFTQPIGMKKSRSGILLTVICYPEQVITCKKIIFCETTTLGVRERIQQRSILNREIESVETLYGQVRLKIASWEKNSSQEIINVQPEYEDCALLARQHNIPWRKIHQVAIDSYQKNLNYTP
ncbi:MAG: nickel pincer cofactor biosynthesis protein LarC [Pleurocapsa sp.]